MVAPDCRIDVALPQDVAAADVYPEILRLTGRPQPPGTPTGYHLFRLDGTVLDGARTLAEQRVLDGELLTLRPFAQSLPPAVFDDVADAVASAVTRDRRLWNGELLRAAGLGAGVLMLALLGLVLWYAEPVRHDMHGLPGIVAGVLGVLLTAVAAVRARVYEDRGSAVAVGLGALPLLMIAGSGIVAPHAGEGPGRLQFLLGCVTVLVASVVLVALLPGGDAPFVAAVLLAATGTLASFAVILTGAAATAAAAVCAPAAIGLVAFLPALSTRFARLPIGYTSPRAATPPYGDPGAPTHPHGAPVDAERIAARARRGHELLLGLVGGCAATVTGSAAVLSLTGGPDAVWPRLLTLAAGLALLLRARLFRYTAQVACVLAAGLGALALLILGLALDLPAHQPEIRTIWLSAAVAAGAALITAIALIVPARGVSPLWARLTDLTESTTLLTLVPLTLATLDLYESARSLTS
ncbi:type VII secretion integral membrane protein EccD [Streptomyces sp. HUAS YS2]|uniref:Type VII secretion integral membrane protein EccD n=1 Tax=Streptomyces solicathayae TaxID=3081768 RepID=A0ABZ0M4C1_9ACTN|nr:type VII secretion integral membrane protein EccD [Streptomyces sp. HUAS YS2]WOX26592.1 type VII secretion integral membrane protein EccD [Streptomyces sp. HUAS YS2]